MSAGQRPVAAPSRRRLLIGIAGLGVLAYMAAALATDAGTLAAALRKLGWTGTALVLGLSLLNYLLRFERWARYLAQLGHRLPRPRHRLIYLAGFAFTVSPAKAGEAVRSLYLRPQGVGYADSIAALAVERLLDLLAMAVLATLIVIDQPRYRLLLAAAVLLTAGLVWLLGQPQLPRALDALAARRSNRLGQRLQQGLQHLAQLLRSARQLLQPRLLLAGLLTGLVAWGAEGIGFGLILSGLDQPLSLNAATGIYAIAVLAGGAAFFLPGGIGGMEIVMSTLLVAQGVPLPVAVIATLMCRLATLWFAVAIGLVAAALLEARAPALPSVSAP